MNKEPCCVLVQTRQNHTKICLFGSFYLRHVEKFCALVSTHFMCLTRFSVVHVLLPLGHRRPAVLWVSAPHCSNRRSSVCRSRPPPSRLNSSRPPRGSRCAVGCTCGLYLPLLRFCQCSVFFVCTVHVFLRSSYGPFFAFLSVSRACLLFHALLLIVPHPLSSCAQPIRTPVHTRADRHHCLASDLAFGARVRCRLCRIATVDAVV